MELVTKIGFALKMNAANETKRKELQGINRMKIEKKADFDVEQVVKKVCTWSYRSDTWSANDYFNPIILIRFCHLLVYIIYWNQMPRFSCSVCVCVKCWMFSHFSALFSLFMYSYGDLNTQITWIDVETSVYLHHSKIDETLSHSWISLNKCSNSTFEDNNRRHFSISHLTIFNFERSWKQVFAEIGVRWVCWYGKNWKLFITSVGVVCDWKRWFLCGSQSVTREFTVYHLTRSSFNGGGTHAFHSNSKSFDV